MRKFSEPNTNEVITISGIVGVNVDGDVILSKDGIEENLNDFITDLGLLYGKNVELSIQLSIKPK